MNGIRVRLAADAGPVQSALRRYRIDELPRERQAFVVQLLERGRMRIAERTPAESGRLRRSWQDGESGDARVRRMEGASVSEVLLENGVSYVKYVEYGTRRMAPRGMVRGGLAALAAEI